MIASPLRVVLLSCLLALASGQAMKKYLTFAHFQEVLPSNPSEYLYDDYTSYPSQDGGFPQSYSFTQNGYSYQVNANGGLSYCTDTNGTYWSSPQNFEIGNPMTMSFGTPYPTAVAFNLETLDNTCSSDFGNINVLINGNAYGSFHSDIDVPPFFVGVSFVPDGIQSVTLEGDSTAYYFGVSYLYAGADVHPNIAGDPHFQGFQGETFDFGGVGGKWFGLISAANFQLNALFTPTCPGNEKGNLLTAMGMNLNGNKLFINNTGEATLNGESITVLAEWKTPYLVGVNGVEGKVAHPWPHFYHLETPFLEITFTIHYVKNPRPGCLTSFFDIEFHDKTHKYPMHGVIGQTAEHVHNGGHLHDKPKVSHDHIVGQGEGEIEGVFVEYIVSSAFASDFVYNLYSGKP